MTLINKNYSYLYKIIKRRIRNTEESEDRLQSAMVKCLLYFNNLKDKTKFIPWIYKIAINERVRKFEELPPLFYYHNYDYSIILQEVYKKIDSLPKRMREVMYKKYYMDTKLTGTERVIHHYAIRKLRDI